MEFKTKEEYYEFLEKLKIYCDIVIIDREDDLPIKDINCIMREKSKTKEMRGFPGYGDFKREKRVEMPSYPLSKNVISTFKKYESFLEVGFDPETELGFDMAFYKGEDVVFYTVRHEDLCILADKHVSFFEELFQDDQSDKIQIRSKNLDKFTSFNEYIKKIR